MGQHLRDNYEKARLQLDTWKDEEAKIERARQRRMLIGWIVSLTLGTTFWALVLLIVRRIL